VGFDVEAHGFAGESLDEPSGCLWAGQDHWDVGIPGYQALRPFITQLSGLPRYSSRASEVGNHGNQSWLLPGSVVGSLTFPLHCPALPSALRPL
jgi:hypothetical protein